MTFHKLPKAQGLYQPEFEHDACGIGLYAHIKGLATHDIVKKGLEMLCRPLFPTKRFASLKE